MGNIRCSFTVEGHPKLSGAHRESCGPLVIGVLVLANVVIATEETGTDTKNYTLKLSVENDTKNPDRTTRSVKSYHDRTLLSGTERETPGDGTLDFHGRGIDAH